MAATPIQRMLRQAARRDLLASSLRRVGMWLALVCGFALLVLAVDRWFGLGISPWLYGAVTALGVVGGMMHAAFTRRDPVDVAVTLDRSLKLKDRIGSALAVDHPALAGAFKSHDEGFAELVRRDAAALAGRVDVRAATPIYLTRAWAAAVTLAIVLCIGLAFLPDFAQQRVARRAQAENAAQEAARLEAQKQAEALRQTIQTATADLPRDFTEQTGVNDGAAAAQLEALDRLAAQLSSDQTTKPEDVKAAREESAAALDNLAERMAEQAQRELQAIEEMQRRFAGMDDANVKDAPLTAQELAEAIKRGDFGAAGEQLQQLLDESQNQYTDAQRQAAAETLRHLADEMDRSGEQSQVTAQQRREQVREALQTLGVDENTAENLLGESPARDDAPNDGESPNEPPPTQDEARDILRDRGLDEDVADRVARDLESLRQQDQTDRRVNEDTRDLSEAMDRAADAVEKGEQLPEPEPQRPPQAQPQRRPPESQPQDQTRFESQDGRERRDQPRQPDGSGERHEASGDRQPPAASQRDGASDDARQASQTQSQSQPQQHQQPADESSRQPPPDGESTESATQPQQRTHEQQNSAASQPQQPSESPSGSREQHPTGAAQSQPSQQTTGEQQRPDQQSQQQPGQQPQTVAQTQPSDRSQAQRDSEAPSPESAPGDQRQQANNTQSQRDDGQQRQPEQQPGQQQRQEQDRQQRQQSQHQQQDRATSQPNDQSGSTPDPTQTPSLTPDQLPSQTPDPNSLPDPDSIPGELLRKMAERAKEAAKDQQTAERLREMARQLAENMSPEQRERWAEALERELGDEHLPQQEQAAPGDGAEPDEQLPQQPDDSQGRESQKPRDQASGNGSSEGPGPPPASQPRDDASRLGGQGEQDTGGSSSGDPNANRNDARDAASSGAPPRSTSRNRQPGTSGAPQRSTVNPNRLDTGETDERPELDLRGAETADQIIARWLSDQPPPASDGQPPRAAPADAPGAAAQRVQAAQKVAERAVNDSAVNKRYHRIIRRYFGRLPETIDNAARGQTPPTAEATGASESTATSQPGG